MKLVTYLDSSGKSRTGISENSKIIDLQNAYQWLVDQGKAKKADLSLVSDMLTLIDHSDKSLEIAKAVFQFAKESQFPDTVTQEESQTKLLAPLPNPRSCRDGYAFRQHVESARKGRGVPMIPEFDHFPVFYFTNHLAITGPGEIKVMPKTLERFDFELEAAIVLGKKGRNIPASKADEYIFGYTIMNDWSARESQSQEMKLNLGPAKGKDFATSIGPYLIPRQYLQGRIPSPDGERYDMRMQAFLNGKQVSDGNLKDMTWTFAQILERVSYGVTVHPGEVIGSGTVGTGCFMELNLTKVTDNLWIKPGDHMVLEIDQLGKLENTIAEEKP